MAAEQPPHHEREEPDPFGRRGESDGGGDGTQEPPLPLGREGTRARVMAGGDGRGRNDARNPPPRPLPRNDGDHPHGDGDGHDEDRLAFVGVIGEDDRSMRLRVLSTPSPPPRSRPEAPPSLQSAGGASSASPIPPQRLASALALGGRRDLVVAPPEEGRRGSPRGADPAGRSALPGPDSPTRGGPDDGGLADLREASVSMQRDKAESVRSVRCRLAGLAARISRENLEREAGLRRVQAGAHALLETAVVDPALQRHDAARHETSTALHALDRRAARADAAMARALHRDASDQLREGLGAARRALEAASGSHRDRVASGAAGAGSAFRALDRMAGDARRRLDEERSARTASCELAGSRVREQFEWDPRTEGRQQLLDRILELRRQVRLERSDRLRRDAALRQEIRRATLSMKRALLSVVVAENEDGGRAAG